MCGIVGYTGEREAVPVLLEGLRRLEYRGYDSAGIAVGSHGVLTRRRAAGKLRNLEERLALEPAPGNYGIGHTRWATHGRPTEENAHPHIDSTGRVVVVHNGIIENYMALKTRLAGEGCTFVTATDTEVIAHLVGRALRGDLFAAVRMAVSELEGLYAVVLMDGDEPGRLVAARSGPPLVVGVGDGETFVASDVSALLPFTREVVFLEDGDVADIRPGQLLVVDKDGVSVSRPSQRIVWDPVQVEKGGFRHFMLKEIHEQPRAVRDTLLGRISLESGDVHLEELGAAAEEALSSASRIVLLACGTSWHAALVGKFFFERLALVPAEVDYASEYRYRLPLAGPETLAIAISQSGETADTLAAAREARRLGARLVAICNVPGSFLAREALGTLLTHAGPEIGVASTKAFTAQLAALALLALFVGRRRGTLDAEEGRRRLESLARIPYMIEEALRLEPTIDELAKRLGNAADFLYLGRGVNYPIALEGALKLKEISYIHAEGYPAGEMKHGPIALVDEALPVVALCPTGPVREKMISNVQEVKARGGRVVAISSGPDESLSKVLDPSRDTLLVVPQCDEIWSPFVTVVPLQLLAYHIALRAGRDVDQPRNLAKSVTVE